MANWKLPAVLPVIIHHGESSFTAPLQLADIQQQVSGLEDYLVYLAAMLIDFKPILSLELPEDAELAAQFLAMQGVFEKDVDIYLVEGFKRLFSQFGKTSTVADVLKQIFYYAATGSKYFTVEKYKETIKEIETIGGDMPVLEEPIYLIDVLEAKGRKEGRKEKEIEMIHNLLNEGLDLNFIVRVTGLSLAEVKRVQADGSRS